VEAGLDRLEEVSDRIFRREEDEAREALGLAGSRQLTRPDYWMGVFNLDENQFSELLVQLAINFGPSARRLPKGSVAKLRRWAKQHGKRHSLEPVALPSEPVRTSPPFRWRNLGSRKRTTSLTAHEIEQVHWELVKDFVHTEDPMEPAGIRSRDLLESAAFRPETSHGSNLKYPTAEMAAAALFQAIVHNHAFHNGNKRTALVAMLVQLERSNLTVTCSDNDLFRLALRAAQHRIPVANSTGDEEVTGIAEWICQNSRLVDKSVRPISWRRLRRVLGDLGCEISRIPGTRKVTISRTIPGHKRLLGRPQPRTLRTQMQHASDADDISRPTIARIRAELSWTRTMALTPPPSIKLRTKSWLKNSSQSTAKLLRTSPRSSDGTRLTQGRLRFLAAASSPETRRDHSQMKARHRASGDGNRDGNRSELWRTSANSGGQ